MPEIRFGKIAEAYDLKYIEVNDENEFENLSSLNYDKENYLIEIKLEKNDYPLRD